MSSVCRISNERYTSSQKKLYLLLSSMVVYAYMFSVNVYAIWYVACALVFAATLCLLAIGSIRLTNSWTPIILVSVYFLYIFMSSFWSISFDSTLRYVAIDIIYFFVFLIFYILVLNLPLKMISSNLTHWVYPGIASSIYFFNFGQPLDRIGVHVYTIFPAILPYILLNVFYAKGFRRYGLWALALAALLLLLVSMSRTPLGTGIMVSIFSLVAFGGVNLYLVNRILFGGIILVGGGASLWLFEPTREALARAFMRALQMDIELAGIYIDYEGVDIGRALLFEAMNDVIFRFQPLGMGYRSFSVWAAENLGVSKSIHNTYHALLVEGGMVLAFIALFMISFFFFGLAKLINRSRDRYKRNFAKATVISMMGICLFGYFHQIHQAPSFFIILGIGFGLINKGSNSFDSMPPVEVSLKPTIDQIR